MYICMKSFLDIYKSEIRIGDMNMSKIELWICTYPKFNSGYVHIQNSFSLIYGSFLNIYGTVVFILCYIIIFAAALFWFFEWEESQVKRPLPLTMWWWHACTSQRTLLITHAVYSNRRLCQGHRLLLVPPGELCYITWPVNDLAARPTRWRQYWTILRVSRYWWERVVWCILSFVLSFTMLLSSLSSY